MAKVYGIDLGTTYSAIATLDDNGMPEVIENFTDGMPLLASAVYFPGGGDPVVGKEAKNQADVEPDNVIQFIKREIGKADAKERIFDGVNYDPILISSLILKRMREYAEEQGHDVKDVVITCPAYFGNEERTATRQAGIIAGLNVLNIVNEPTAAALNYCAREFQQARKIMVYDLGGGTFDITLFDFGANDEGVFTIDVINSGGNDRLGGVDWDDRLYKLVCALYSDENGITYDEMDSELRQKIRSQVEDVKRSLSTLKSFTMTVKHDGDATRLQVSREAFEEHTKDLVEQTKDLVHKLLQDSGVAAAEVDTVLLVGGSTSMPMIQDAVEGLFPGKWRYEQPNLAVAKGAALAAALAWNERIVNTTQNQTRSQGIEDGNPVDSDDTFGDEFQSVTSTEMIGAEPIPVPQQVNVVNDKVSRSFGPAVLVGTDDYLIDNLLFVGDPVPSEATGSYVTPQDNMPVINLTVFENVATDRQNTYVTPSVDWNGNPQYTDPALKVKSLGSLQLPLPPLTPKGSEIRVFFRVSTIGVEVRASNVATGQSVDAVLNYESVKSDAELEEAIALIAAKPTSGNI